MSTAMNNTHANKVAPQPNLGAVEVIYRRLERRKARLARNNSGALLMTAAMLHTLGSRLERRVSEFAEGTSSRYVRGQFLGEYGMQVEDLARIARREPAAVAAALDTFMGYVGHQVTRRGDGCALRDEMVALEETWKRIRSGITGEAA